MVEKICLSGEERLFRWKTQEAPEKSKSLSVLLEWYNVEVGLLPWIRISTKLPMIYRRRFWMIYSEKVIDHFLHPRNVGGIEDADGFARIKGPCGDTVYIFLKVNGARITDAKFLTDGCGTTIACGSVVTDMVKGREIKDASKIRHTHVLAAVGGLPEADAHCAVLAASTLRAAIKNYLLAKR